MEVNIKLSPSQVKKLTMGHSINLSKQAVKGGPYKLIVHPMVYKRLMRARKNNKGVRLMLSKAEIEGSGIMDVLKNIFEGGKKVFRVAKKVYEPFKPLLAPILKGAVQNVAQQGVEKLGTKSPFAAEIAKTLTPAAIDLVGQKTGAYGMRSMRMLASKPLAANYSNLLSPYHPAMNTQKVRLPDPSSGYSRISDFSDKQGGSIMNADDYKVINSRGNQYPAKYIHPAIRPHNKLRLPDPESSRRGGGQSRAGSFRAF
jgi:hypothetical protein